MENTVSASQPDGTYKGAANYQSFIQKNPNAPGKFASGAKSVTVIVLTLVAALTGPNFPGALGFFWMKDPQRPPTGMMRT
jgi:hypothetical protein